MAQRRTRIPPFSFANAFHDSYLENIYEQHLSARTDLSIDFRELRPHGPSELLLENGKLKEWVQGEYVPRRVVFNDVDIKYFEGVYRTLKQAPASHKARELIGMLTWQMSGEAFPSYRLMHGSDEADLWFSAHGYVEETRKDAVKVVEFTRRYSPAPPLPEGLVPAPPEIHRKFGGDPVSIFLGRRRLHWRLFVGGLDSQPEVRPPQMDVVFNVGESKSKWVQHPTPVGDGENCDRWVVKGEGAEGMSVEEMKSEAEWIIQLLRQNKRVLVHCVAGFNRSVTLCTAVLILLEGLPAEAALARVREHHPWGQPDATHWLRLKWLAKENHG